MNFEKNEILTKKTTKLDKSESDKVITHFYLNDKYLKEIPKFSNPINIQVLYLYCNEISEIKNLQNAVNLHSLYLQKNRILKIENLTKLKKLKKIFLGHNTISVVEGLEDLESLQELHLEKQFLSEGNVLCFDPRSILNISETLQILNISNNRIQTIANLKGLRNLRVLNASYNHLNDIKEICQVINEWFHLKDINLLNNPIEKDRLYRENIISNAYCLEMLDEKKVTSSSRNFFKRLNNERITNNFRKMNNLADYCDLPKNHPISVQKAVSMNIIKERELYKDSDENFEEKNVAFVPWKTLPKPITAVKAQKYKKLKKEDGKRTNIVNFQI